MYTEERSYVYDFSKTRVEITYTDLFNDPLVLPQIYQFRQITSSIDDLRYSHGIHSRSRQAKMDQLIGRKIQRGWTLIRLLLVSIAPSARLTVNKDAPCSQGDARERTDHFDPCFK